MQTVYKYVFVVLLSSALNAAFWQGLFGSDDLGYSNLAAQVMRGRWHLAGEGHHIGRIGVYLPLAASFRVLGINELALGLVPMASTVLTSVLLCAIGTRLAGPRVGLLAGVLHACFPLTLQWGSTCIPEPMAGFEITAAALLYLGARAETASRRNAAAMKLAAGALVGIAYLTTEFAAILVPVLLAGLVLARRFDRTDWAVASGFACVLLGEMAFYSGIYGSPSYRFTRLGGDYLADPMVRDANSDLARRLLKSYTSMFVYPFLELGYFGPLMTLAVASALTRVRSSAFLLAWAGTILAFYNFFSVKLTRYVALPVSARLIYPACLPLLVLVATMLGALLDWGRARGAAQRLISQVLCAGAVLWVCLTSLLAVSATKGEGLTPALARNARAVAAHFRGEPRLVLASDPRTLAIVSFYRAYSSRDTLIDLGTAADLRAELTGVDGHAGYITINGPLYSLEAPERQGAFEPHARRDRRMDAVLASGVPPAFELPAARAPLQSSLVKLCKNLGVIAGSQAAVLDRPPTNWVKVFPASTVDMGASAGIEAPEVSSPPRPLAAARPRGARSNPAGGEM
jgi:hypothetical protein